MRRVRPHCLQLCSYCEKRAVWKAKEVYACDDHEKVVRERDRLSEADLKAWTEYWRNL